MPRQRFGNAMSGTVNRPEASSGRMTSCRSGEVRRSCEVGLYWRKGIGGLPQVATRGRVGVSAGGGGGRGMGMWMCCLWWRRMETSGRSVSSRRLMVVWASIEGKMRQDLLCACEVYLKVGGYVVADEGLGIRQEVVRGMTRKEALTVISSAADRDTGFVRWSRYLTFTFWDGDRSLL